MVLKTKKKTNGNESFLFSDSYYTLKNRWDYFFCLHFIDIIWTFKFYRQVSCQIIVYSYEINAHCFQVISPPYITGNYKFTLKAGTIVLYSSQLLSSFILSSVAQDRPLSMFVFCQIF